MKQIEEENFIQREEKDIYEKPTIEVIQMEMENILCASAPSFEGGDWG